MSEYAIPPRQVTEYLHAIEAAVDALEETRPDGMFLDIRVKWHGEQYAKLYEEGWIVGEAV